MKRISQERDRINGYRFGVGNAEFFNNRSYKEDMEWLTLSYMVDTLRKAGFDAPAFAEKLTEPQPDFQTYAEDGEKMQKVEVTEVLSPDFRRGEFFRNLSDQGLNNYPISQSRHPTPWRSFKDVLRKKMAKRYAGKDVWLLVYHDMSASQFPGSQPWHEHVLDEIQKWGRRTACDVSQSQFGCIYVVDASGDGAVRLHPFWDVICPSPYPRGPR